MDSKIWVGMEIFINSNWKFKVTCKNADFKFWYIRIHSEEKPSKISNITCFYIRHYAFFSHQNTWTKLSSWVLWSLLDETIRCASKWFILTQRKHNLELVNLKWVTNSFLWGFVRKVPWNQIAPTEPLSSANHAIGRVN